MNYDQLAAEAEALSPMERAELAHRLLATLDDDPPESTAAFQAMLARRLADHDAGHGKTIDAEAFLEELKREFP